MDGPPPQEEDFSSLSISDRLGHKNWKARVNGYEALIKTFQTTASDTDPAFKPYIKDSDLLKKIATDSNAVAQEKGVECLVALVKFSGETSAKTREAVMPALVDKCFGSTRAGTKNQAVELALQYVEVENGGAGVVSDLLPGLGAKQPKTVAGCVLALKEIIRLFGTSAVPPAPILKALPKIFAHTDKTVRAEGTLLTLALYQNLGPGIEPWLADLKPVQVKELKEAFEGMEKDGKGKGSLKAERLTRAQAREAEMAGGDDGSGAPVTSEPEEPELPDPRTLSEPVDIVPKLASTFKPGLASSKWKERKEVLDDLLILVNATPRIQDASELGEVARSLAVCVQKDANINCVIVAAGCVEGLAKGMMGPFGRFRESVVGPMLERMKERKANVTDAIGAALDAVFATTTLSEIMPDILAAIVNKNPQVKEGSLKFLNRCLATSPVALAPPQLKSVLDPLSGLLEDGFAGARDEAASCLGTLMKMVGERPLNALVDGLADVRKAKVKEAYEKATVKCKAVAPAKAAPPAAKAPPPKKTTTAKKETTVVELEAEPLKKPVAKPPTAKKLGVASASPSAPPVAAVKKPAPPASSKPSKGGAAPAPGGLDTFKYKHTPEDAEALAADLIPSNLATDLGDANWKTRLAALEEMTGWVEGTVDEVDAEVVIRALAKKGWSEKNFQVSSKLYGILSVLADRCPSFGRSCVALCVAHLSEKLGDMKLKKPAGETLIIFSEKTSLQFVLNQAYEPLSKQKAPKVLADAVAWIDSALIEFGIAGVSLRSLIEFLKTALQNSNAAVRTSATKTLVTVKLFAGSSIKDFLEDLNPQLLTTITSEFDKAEGKPTPEPTRTCVDLLNAATSSGAPSGKALAGGADPLDDLFPRVEIDGLLKGTTILIDGKSDAWKTKKEALETLQAILDQGANKRLKPQMGEIGQILKSRVTDANKAVQSLALDIVARIATGMGKPFEKHTRFFALPVATVLADQKAPIRAAAIQTLTAIATACDGVESMVPGLTTALESTNPTQRASLLNWMQEWFQANEPSSSLDLTGWAGSVVACLDDRSSDIRKAAQALLPTVIMCAGYDHVMQQTSSLKPASRATAVPLIQAARTTIQSNAPPPTTATAAKSNTRPPTISAPSPTSVSPPPESPVVPSVPVVKAGSSKATGVRRKLPQGSSSRPESRAEEPPASRLSTKPGSSAPKRPGVAASSARAAQSPIASNLPLFGTSVEAKKARLGKDAQRWINEGGATKKEMAELLQHQMEPHVSKDLIALLFSHDHNAVNDYISGLTTMTDFYSSAQAEDERFGAPDEVRVAALANFDLPLKYASMKAHEPQSNLAAKCLDVVDAVLGFLRSVNCQLTDPEALCFIPTMVYKLGDAREPVRVRIQNIVQSLPKVYAYSRVFQLLLEHGLKSKVAKTRQGALDEMAGLLKRSGMGACEPNKAFPIMASMIADKDSQVRKSALTAISEGYSLVGEKVWSFVGPLSPKDKTQLEERLRRVAGPSSLESQKEVPAPPSQITRLQANILRPGSPSTTSRAGGIPRPGSPSMAGTSKLARSASPATFRSVSPAPNNARPASPVRTSRLPGLPGLVAPSSPSAMGRPKSILPSRLGAPRTRPNFSTAPPNAASQVQPTGGHSRLNHKQLPSAVDYEDAEIHADGADDELHANGGPDDITITISSILSSDPLRSVDALKKVQKILVLKPEDGMLSPQYQELAEHTEGLIETITLQMAHVFDRPEDLVVEENFRLAKHLIQTLNNFCDHSFLAESLTVDILTALLEELTLRLLETDESSITKVKDLSRFINMIILRLFATGRRMSIFRSLFALLLQIVKPFPAHGTLPDSQESKVAELVLKCVWKLARNIPQDLKEDKLDPVELFPAIEHFLQSVPPNEWRARATNKVPCGDMPLRTIKVIIQHVVAHYGDEVYDLLSGSFDDPSATIVYPYVYRILNSNARAAEQPQPIARRNGLLREQGGRSYSPSSSRPISPMETTSSAASVHHRRSSPSHRTSPSSSSANGNGLFSPTVEEPDPDAQLLTIIGHISSETTGALHKEGITELHHFLKAYPHKKPRVEKMLESTGAAFRKYINRALASRAAEDQERNVAVADTLSKLESKQSPLSTPVSPMTSDFSPRTRPPVISDQAGQDKLSRLHDIFQYRSSTISNGSSHGPTTPTSATMHIP